MGIFSLVHALPGQFSLFWDHHSLLCWFTPFTKDFNTAEGLLIFWRSLHSCSSSLSSHQHLVQRFWPPRVFGSIHHSGETWHVININWKSGIGEYLVNTITIITISLSSPPLWKLLAAWVFVLFSCQQLPEPASTLVNAVSHQLSRLARPTPVM